MRHDFNTNDQQRTFGSTRKYAKASSASTDCHCRDDFDDSTTCKNATQAKLNDLLNLLSLERMLFGRGDTPPAAFPSFEGKLKKEQGQQNTVCTARLDSYNWLYQQSTGASFDNRSHEGQQFYIEPLDAAWTDDAGTANLAMNRLSLERMLFGQGVKPLTAFPSLTEEKVATTCRWKVDQRSVNDGLVDTNMSDRQESRSRALPRSVSHAVKAIDSLSDTVQFEPSFS